MFRSKVNLRKEFLSFKKDSTSGSEVTIRLFLATPFPWTCEGQKSEMDQINDAENNTIKPIVDDRSK